MAEEEKKAEKKSSSSKMYGKSPRIEKAPAKGDTVKSEGGAPKEAAAKAEESAGEPKSEATYSEVGDGGTNAAKGDVMAGTDGIPTHHMQSNEREAMHGRQSTERAEAHGRHERDHLMRATGNSSESHEDMTKRHVVELRHMHAKHEKEVKDMGERHAGGGPDMTPDSNVGESGTQPT